MTDTTTCPVTLFTPRGLDSEGKFRTTHEPCGQPVDRWGWCAKHAGDHVRLCGGCARCSGPDERYPCGCVRYGDRWVPEDCAMHAAVGGVL